MLTFLYGIATAMFVPTLSSSVPFMVQRGQLTAANALLQSTTSVGIIVGPVLSGLGIAFSGSQDVLCINAVTYLASAACLIPIRIPGGIPQQGQQSRLGAAINDLVEGMRYTLISQRSILLLIIMASIYTFGTSASAPPSSLFSEGKCWLLDRSKWLFVVLVRSGLILGVA